MKAFLILLLIFICAAAPGLATEQADYVAGVDEWHAGRIERLHRSDGWLTLVGLIALPEGRSSFGCGEAVDLRISANAAAHIGDLVIDGKQVRFIAAAQVTLGGEAIGEIELAADNTGEPTVLHSGSVSFYLIRRHGRPYLRVKDASAELLQTFEGIDRWPVDESWKVVATWELYKTPQKRSFPNVLGQATETEVAGEARFTHDGQEFALYPNSTSDDSWFWVFGDATNGMESYGAGRFLYTDGPDTNGHIVLDFNRSYNPPCVFTPFATCPLPSEGNNLDLRITAGEKMFGTSH
ncbi:DUF1684 domain-containing protein [bacterium]|nr:MAG: DUF1684 domain-containing protein [bacterium]